ncbi:hypothetical protein BDN71DRAFT_1506241 [Pleurotus eryngii]|uniref:Uncharacterized protein n=1 Tax=Pleurotus eryngii TaxID=5323 RepID=A0A9P6DFW4_PLEER|nr:hypothetical protein BDN71DRAFT_1506241 [Pleurotus eryngii]
MHGLTAPLIEYLHLLGPTHGKMLIPSSKATSSTVSRLVSNTPCLSASASTYRCRYFAGSKPSFWVLGNSQLHPKYPRAPVESSQNRGTRHCVCISPARRPGCLASGVHGLCRDAGLPVLRDRCRDGFRGGARLLHHVSPVRQVHATSDTRDGYLLRRRHPSTVFESCEETFVPLRNHFSAEGVRFVEQEKIHSTRLQRADLEFYARSEDKSSVVFTLWFRNEAPMDICGQIAFEFAIRLPRDDLKLVDIASVDMNKFAWCSLFGQLKGLEEIQAFLYKGLLYALYEDEEGDEGRCTFPSLSKLTLYYDDVDEEKSDRKCWEDLPKVLKFRAGCGLPIRKVTILPHGCLHVSIIWGC